MRFGTILDKVPYNLEERTDELFSQLYDLVLVSDKIGTHKASDFIRKITEGNVKTITTKKPAHP